MNGSSSRLVRALTVVLVLAGFAPALGPGGSAAAPPPREVIVVNPTESPVPVRPARQPFHGSVDMFWEDGLAQAGPGGHGDIPVPEGKRLIIEYVSGTFGVPVGQKVQIELNTGFGTTSVFHRVLAHPHGTFPLPSGASSDAFVVGQVVKIPAEGSIHVFAFRSSGTGIGQGQFVVAGYLEDL